MSADGANNGDTRRPIAFISHHSSQVETARQLKQVLAHNGVDGWMAPDDIDPGRPFDQAIIEQVRRSDLIILLFCSRSDQSRHVKRELMMAENGDKLIFPVRLENIDADGLAYWLNDYQWIDWFDRRDDTIQRMIDTIKRIVQMSAVDQAATSEPAPPAAAPPTDTTDGSDGMDDTIPEPQAEEPPAEPDVVPPVAPPPPPPPPSPPSEPVFDDIEPESADEAEPIEARDDDPGALKVAPVAAGVSDTATTRGDDGSNNKKPILFGVLGLLLLAILLAAVFLWPSDEADDAAAPGVLSPSVDCADMSIPSHARICADPDLSSRETALSQRYQAALEILEGSERVALQQGHAGFLARRDECRSAACVSTVYDAREGELAEYDIPEEALVEEPVNEEVVPEAEVTSPDIHETPDAPTRPEPTREPPTERTPDPATPPASRPPPEPDPPRQSRTTPPQPVGNPSGWVRASDYPSNILRNGEQGTSRYQVRVGANGLPTACFTIGSSGHFQLDARACNMVMSRARFQPARDGSGNAVAGIYSGSHRWRAPR